MNPSNAWYCLVCGYIHYGPEAPEPCPICGAPSSEFRAYEEPAPAPSAPARSLLCPVCGYQHPGAEPPDTCPLCGAPGSLFESATPDENPADQTPADAPCRVVIAGAGIAGLAAAEALRKHAPDTEILLLSDESEPPYYRLNLTRFLAGEIGEEALPVHPPEWYEKNRITLKLNTRITEIRSAKKQIYTESGEFFTCDRLIYTTGAHAFIPPLEGSGLPGVFTLRTAQDARDLLAALPNARHCAVIGGGLLGLETAGALARRGAQVTVIEGHEWLMPRQLTREAGDQLLRHVETLGIQVSRRFRPAAIQGNQQAEAVVLANGQRIEADLIVLATGVRSNIHLLKKEGISTESGILVDGGLQSSAPWIYAAGDAAEYDGMLYGSWAAAQFQGTVAGTRAAGKTAVFSGLPRAHTLKVLGLDMMSIGRFDAPDAGCLALQEETAEAFRRFVFQDEQLRGAILLGDISPGPAIRTALENREHLAALLRGNPSAADVFAFFKAR